MTYFDDGGTHLYYEESGSGEPVLMLPGWGGSIEDLSALRERLAKDHRVIAVDLPGSGRSGPQPRTYTSTYYRDDIPLFVRLLTSRGASPAHVVGFSDGGEYGLLLAAQHPECVRSLVTWGSAGSLGTDPAFTRFLGNLIDDPIPPMADFAAHMKATYGEQNARIMTKSAGAALRQVVEAGGDISRSLAGDIRCPALLITGEHDFLATPALVSEMARAIEGGEFIEASGASHAVHHDRPEWLADAVATWLGQRESVHGAGR